MTCRQCWYLNSEIEVMYEERADCVTIGATLFRTL